MINSLDIYKKANKLVDKFGTRDSLKIAKGLGIDVVFIDYFEKLLGMYAYRWKHRVIFLNNRMNEEFTNMVAAHEIGHDILHRDLAKGKLLQEFELFKIQNSVEYEANAFAAHLLIDTEKCFELIKNGYDVIEISKFCNTEINLMLIKLQEMRQLGYNLNLSEYAHSNFLKNIKA